MCWPLVMLIELLKRYRESDNAMGKVRTINEYQYRGHTAEHCAKLSKAQLARWGAPEGMCTVRGVHVPLEYRDVLAFFGNRVAAKISGEAATAYIQSIKDGGWAKYPALKEKYELAMMVKETRELIREMQWEAYYANRNSR